MLNKIVVLMVLQLWFVIGSGFAQGITIVVSPTASVGGPLITLGQVAEISGDDTPWVNSLGQLKLGNAASPGSSVVLTKELLNMRLVATGSDFSGIVWSIPDSITVTTSSQSISGQAFINKAIDAIKGQIGLQLSSEDFAIAPNGSVQDVITPLGRIELTTTMPYGIRYNMATPVMVAVSVNGQAFTKVPVKVDVKRYQQVVVAANAIHPTDLFSAENLRYQRMNIGRLEAGYFTDRNKVLGLASRRSLQPGMVITDFMAVKPILIKRGDNVNIVARIGSMEITAMGQAMQDGKEGQLIRVKNVNSTKVISAKVLDGATVQVLTYKSNG